MSYVEWLEQSVADAGLHWLSPEVQAVLRVQMMARDRFVGAVKAALRAADITTADEYALALLGEERNLQRVPGEDVETWRNYIMNAPKTWQDAGTLGNLKRQLERLNIGTIAIYEWGKSEPARWAEFSVYVVIDEPPTAKVWGHNDGNWRNDGFWGRDNQPLIRVWGEDRVRWGDDGVWGWDGDPDIVKAALSLIDKWRAAKSKLASLTLAKGAIWGVDDGVWANDGNWELAAEMHTLHF